MKNRIIPHESPGSSIITKLFNPDNTAARTTYNLAEFDAFRDKLKAGLAKQAMQHVADLSIEEERLLRIAPGGEAQYRIIVDLYAKNAMLDIMGGEW